MARVSGGDITLRRDLPVNLLAVPSMIDLDAAVSAADLVILLQPHSCYDLAYIAHAAKLMLDTRGVTSGISGDHFEAL